MSSQFTLAGLTDLLLLFGFGFPHLPVDEDYKAVLSPEEQETVVGNSIILDARLSTDPLGNPAKYHYWAFSQIPIGSRVSEVGFEYLDSDGTRVQYTPDIPGIYEIALIVGDDSFISPPAFSTSYIKINIYPYGKGLIPDVSFIWNYLGDFWELFKDKEFYSTMWGAFAQIAGSRLLSLYQTNFNKSIATIQELFQKRWIDFDPSISLNKEDCYFVLGDNYTGSGARSNSVSLSATNPYVNAIFINASEGSFDKTPYGKKVGKRFLKYWQSSHVLYRGEDSIADLIIPIPISTFFTKNVEIIRSNDAHDWRLCNALFSKTLNFETLGVKYGDILVISISLLFNGVTSGKQSYLNLFITGARDNCIGFVFNGNLITNVPDAGIKDEDVLRICQELMIPGVSLVAGTLTYDPNSPAAFIKNSLNSILFKRIFFEEDLFINDVDIGYFNSQLITLHIEPIKINRKRSIKVDDNIVSIPNLQEFIQQPIISREDGKITVVTSTKTEVTRVPYFLFENLDYISSNKNLFTYANFTSSNIVEIPFGDLIDRSIEQGDFIDYNDQTFIIIEVIDKIRVKINTTLSFSKANVKINLRRRIEGTFIRFCKNIIEDSPKLWSEVVFLNNNKTIEDNFGSIVGISQEQLAKQDVLINYKSAISGLLYGLAKGPTPEYLKIGAQILLGLPFASTRGRIIDIKIDYKVRPDLSPEFGRLIIEEIDSNGVPTGLVNIYAYPQGTQVFVMGKWQPLNPSFSGLAINPATNKEYSIGDVVERFTPLSKGVEVIDYISNPDYVRKVASSPEAQLQKYHTFFLRLNSDVFFGPDLGFVFDYIGKMKPSFVTVKLIVEKIFEDVEIVTDELKFSVTKSLSDIEGISLPFPNILTSYEDMPYILNVGGELYLRYIKGFDLITTGNSTATSSAGGFVNQRINELHDSPFILSDDLLIIYSGVNKGEYPIQTVNSDVSISVSSVLSSAQNQKFSIYRRLKNPIFTGNATFTNGSPNVTLPSGNLSSGLAVGDYIFFYGPFVSRNYRINSVSGTSIVLDNSIVELSANYDFVCYRDGLLTTTLLQTTDFPFNGMFTSGNSLVPISGPFEEMLVKKGDVLVRNDGATFDIYDFNEATQNVYIIPPAPDNTVLPLRIERRYKANSFPIDVDLLTTSDEVKLIINTTDLMTQYSVTTASSDVVDFSMAIDLSIWNILPGDFYKILTGPDSSIDIGYGPGVYVIAIINSITQLTLTRPLTSTQNMADFNLIRVKNN